MNGNLENLIIKNSDFVLVFGVIGIILVMVIPLPASVLDLLFAVNITISLVTLLVVLYMLQPVDFSIFPSLLLVLTMFRLSLNVASTRVILTRGHLGTDAAGKVIQSFAQFVVQGNYVVGFVVFFIILIIQFIVITKGSGRIAEVAARFTLDALPMKQMAIDTDLTAGLITDDEARQRRAEVSHEANFYGAMDGASKFVRGDAIAGLIITAIN
ncbi:TPA: EscV/YscV/HrcV family type III secretion system export apparatus protein, partial [Candidatus Poribacteria bacterium]|nr:EscV/YscV/HrcV family type III secretion system export apparatus protein [Candidatus Poribacteria bacterium]